MSEPGYSFSRKFIEGETLSGFWSLALYGIVSLNSFLIVYFLTVYDYGLYQLILSVIAIALSFTAGIFDDLIVTDLSRYLGKKEYGLAKRLFGEYAFLKLGLTALIFLLLIGGAEIITRYYHQDVAVFLRIASFGIVFGALQSVINIFLKGKIDFSALGASAVGEIGKLSVIVGMILWRGLDVRNVLIAYVAGQIFAFIFSAKSFMAAYVNTFGTVKAAKYSLMKDLLKIHGFWVVSRYFLSRIANNIRPWIIKIFISTEAVGLFMFARTIIAVIMRLMPLGTFGILLPRELEDKDRLRYIFTRVIKYSVLLSIVLAVSSFVLVPVAINLILPKYNSAMTLFRIMSVIIILYGFYKIFRMTLVVLREQKVLFLKSFDNSILAPLMLFILLPIFGLNGTALEWVVTYAITAILFYIYLIKHHPYLKLKFSSLFILDKDDRILIAKIYRMFIEFLKTKLSIKKATKIGGS